MMQASFKLVAIAAALGSVPLAASTSVTPQPAETGAAQASQTPQLVSINYERLYRRMVQAGMVSQVLEYSLSVDAEGKATGCRFGRDFRMLSTEREVCRSFLRSVSFEPARDDAGNPVAGTYRGKVEIASFFQPDR
ncbi:hypothetical protein [Erythrobacter donghaensis]|uniref:hypothetical protein n=1 Tax=Erythrobacter donghaensis TaxID=267135 RepID=UPI000A36BF9E|nr:hypothetical protein [Erythrobacter donghaensis]